MPVHQKARVDEDEDLEDLDDVLDQFSPPAQQISPPPPPPPISATDSTSSKPVEANEAQMNDLTDEFAKQMEDWLKELGVEQRATSEGTDEAVQQNQLTAAWENMLVEGMNGMSGPSETRTSTDASSSGQKKGDFQSGIREAMSKLKESESDLKSSDSSASGGGESESLLSLLQGLGDLSGDGAESEEHLQGCLEAMMGQLVSKDVLYEPLKELHDKFPGYLAEHNSTTSPEDKKRFEAQISCIKRLIDEFETKSYRDEDEKARGKIVELMGELQMHGSLPEEIMGPLPPGFSMGADGLPNMPEECNIN